MVKLSQLLRLLASRRVLVIGDLVLDRYTYGKTDRVSPEAPVLVLDVQREEVLPGGAGNVALNLQALGAEVTVLGRVGEDHAASELQQQLRSLGCASFHLLAQKGWQTPVKNRLIAANQQMVRVDYEEVSPLAADLEEIFVHALPVYLDAVDAVAVSDYGKGFLTDRILKTLFHEAQKRSIPVVTDPKGSQFTKYRGTSLLKPNLKEAYAAAKLALTAPLEEVARVLLQETEARALMITRGEAGISLFFANGEEKHFPVEEKQVKDVTGAGDTVLAVLTFALANGLAESQAAEWCNIAAGIAIERIGCARVSLSDLSLRLLEKNTNHKLFDPEHLFVLQKVLAAQPFALLAISQNSLLDLALFQEIRRLSQEKQMVLLYLLDEDPPFSLVEMLLSLNEVHFVVIGKNGLLSTEKPQDLERFFGCRPKQALLWEGGEAKSLLV